MLSIKKIWFLLVFIAISGCQTAKIPTAYNYRIKDIKTNVFGCWMELTVNSTALINNSADLAGELLSITSDSIFLLTADGVVSSVKKYSIISARLYTHKNQANTYLLTTGFLIIPSLIGAIANPDYRGQFLMLSVPASTVGLIQATIESSGARNILVYPGKNSLEDFSLFARFPGGMPENTDFRLLYLKKN